VRFDRGDLAPVNLAVRVWVRGRDLAGRIEIGGNLPDEFGAKKTLPIILKDERVELPQNFVQTGSQLRDLFLCRSADFFAIDSHDLLVPCNNPRFYNRPEIRVLEHEFGLDFVRVQKIEKSPAAVVGADRADDRDAVDKLSQIA